MLSYENVLFNRVSSSKNVGLANDVHPRVECYSDLLKEFWVINRTTYRFNYCTELIKGFYLVGFLKPCPTKYAVSTVIEVIFNGSSNPLNNIFWPVGLYVISGKLSLNLNKCLTPSLFVAQRKSVYVDCLFVLLKRLTTSKLDQLYCIILKIKLSAVVLISATPRTFNYTIKVLLLKIIIATTDDFI